MSDVRCRACGAAVPSEAQWCSLCFADLREPTLVRERVSVPADHAAAQPGAAASAPPQNRSRPDPDALLGLPVSPLAVAATDTVPADGVPADGEAAQSTSEAPEAAKWPCLRCGAQVPISSGSCHACGAGFLSGAVTATSVRLPVVGDIERLSRTQRLLVGFGISILIMVILVVLATIGGKVL